MSVPNVTVMPTQQTIYDDLKETFENAEFESPEHKASFKKHVESFNPEPNMKLSQVEQFIEEMQEASTSSLEEDISHAKFGDTLDGPAGAYVGTYFDPRNVYLNLSATSKECAERLVRGRKMTARQRNLLRRHGVLLLTASATPREKLRAAARWWRLLEDMRDDIPNRPQHLERWEKERGLAMSVVFEVGAAPLAAATAKKWIRPGNTTDFDDVRQAAMLGMVNAVHRYDYTQGALSSYAIYPMNDSIGQIVREQEHPHLPRSAFKSRRAILDYVKECIEKNPDCDKQPGFYEEVAEKFSVTAKSVEKVLHGAKDVSINAPAKGSGSGASEGSSDDDFGGMFADDGPSPYDMFASEETAQSLRLVLSKYLTDEEREILFRYEGIGFAEPEDLTRIGERYKKSRTWAGGRRKKALAKMQFPTVMSEIVGYDTNPQKLSDEEVTPKGKKVLDCMSQRECFIAVNVLGIGGAPIRGTPTERMLEASNKMQIPMWQTAQIVQQTLRKHPDAKQILSADTGVQDCLRVALKISKEHASNMREREEQREAQKAKSA